MNLQHFFDEATNSFTYLISDPVSKQAAVIDPVLDFDPAAVATKTTSAEQLLSQIKQQDLQLKWILETHVHADHMSAAYWLKQQTGASIVIGYNVTQVQDTFNRLYALPQEQMATPNDFDRLVNDGDELELGEWVIKVLHTPGHTPSCCTYHIDGCAFVGDTIFMPDFGTSRCDFPGGDAAQLYQSIQKIYALGDDTQLYMCHDYRPGGRELKWKISVAEQKQTNKHINQEVSEQDFVKMRTERDQQLSVPKLILPALQVNIKAGRLPLDPESGTSFLRLPLNQF